MEDMKREFEAIKNTIQAESKWIREEFNKVHEELRTESKWVREEFGKVHEEFNKVHAESTWVREEFKQIHEHLRRLSIGHARNAGDIYSLREEMKDGFKELRGFMLMYLEKFAVETESVRRQRVFTDRGMMHHESRLGDHEKRIKRLEARPKTA